MFSITHIFMILEKVGMINFNQSKSEKRYRAQNYFVWFNNCLSYVHLCCQSLSVFSRAIRYYPEFNQTFLENSITFSSLSVAFYLRKVQRDIYSACKLTESFSKADSLVVQACHRQSKRYYIACVTAVFLALLATVLETVIPISKTELDIRRNVYRTKHPERRLPYNTRIPFIDESESWAYEIIYAYQLYLIIYLTICLGSMISIVPFVVIHMRGQYEILSKYISMIGQVHRDSLNNRIFYTDIYKNEYYIIKEKLPVIPGPKPNERQLLKENLRRQKQYEANYLRQIIRFHHKLLTFQDVFARVISPFMSGLVVASTLFIVLCLYQLVVSSTDISLIRYLKFVGVFLAVVLEFYLICCNSSEVADDCNVMMVNAVKHSSWVKITYQTRRDLCILLRRVQQPNHFKFNEGMLVLGRPLFLKAVKMAYSFLNFMRFKTSGA